MSNESMPIKKVEPRAEIESSSLVQVERNPDNFMSNKSYELTNQVFDIPSGAFSGIATYREDGIEKRISPTLDRLMAENFTNIRYIVKELNKTREGLKKILDLFKKREYLFSTTSKDPREKYKGDIDKIIEKTKEDLDQFSKSIDKELVNLEQKNISPEGYEKSKQILASAKETYNILIRELELKKRGFDFLGKGENIGKDDSLLEANMPLEIKYLPGGNIVILRGYVHNQIWQNNFGDDRDQDFGLAQIYKNVKYVGIEGYGNTKFGESLKEYWEDNDDMDYSQLMKELVKEGFKGSFFEIDTRFRGEFFEKTLDFKDLTNKEAEALYDYLTKYNRELGEKIGNIDRYKEFFSKQRSSGLKDSLYKRAEGEGLQLIKDGTLYHNNPSVKEDLSTSASPTGFELGQMAFSDALSVIKILIMNNAIHKGKLESGMIVDFQGAAHLSYKSYFFDNPQYAMEVVLNNIHEILAHFDELKNTDEILEKLKNLDKATWERVFRIIGEIPFAIVSEATIERDSIEIGENQRPMTKKQSYQALDNLTNAQKIKLEGIITEFANKR